LPESISPTLYARYGDRIAAGLLAIGLGLVIGRRRRDAKIRKQSAKA
jgi:hypothetical protein